MSHEFESGAFGDNRAAWHGLGTVVAGAMSSAEAIKLAGLDWKVERQPLYWNRENLEMISGYYANVRSSDSSVLGVVSKDYKLIQNEEWFQFLDVLLAEGLEFDTAGSLFKGKQVFMLAKMPDSFKVAGDEFSKYLLATNGHDGKHVGRILCTDIRVVCWNTLSQALAEAMRSWSIRHTSTLQGKEDEVRQHLKLANLYFKAYEKKMEELLAKTFSQSEWINLVTSLIPPASDEASDNMKKKIQERQLKLASVLYTTDNLDNVKNTAYGAVQAVADFVGHAQPLRKTDTWLENKFSNTLIKGDPMIHRAMELVLN